MNGNWANKNAKFPTLKGLSLAYFKFIYYSSFYVKAMLTLPQNTMSRPLILAVAMGRIHWLLQGG